MTDPFASPKRRVARAKRHIGDLDGRIIKFFKKQPYAQLVEKDSDGTTDLHKIKLTKPLPMSMSDLATTIIEDLRSSLDQAAFATAFASGQIVAKSAYFPIADDEPGLETGIKGRCKDVPTDIVTLFRTFKPYKAGNGLVWALNRLCNTSKHRLLVPVGTASAGMRVTGMTLSAGADGLGVKILTPRWNSEKNEITFASVGAGSKVSYNLNFAFFVAFGEVEPVQGQPIVPILSAMTSEVDRIILATEAEARRIGLV